MEAIGTVSQRAPDPTLLRCLMGGLVDVLGESKIDTYTYICRPVVDDSV